MSENSGYQVKSVAKAMLLLDYMAEAGKPMTLQEIAAQTGLPKSTVYGLLSAMRENSVVEQSPENGNYRLGIRLFEYGCHVSGNWDVIIQSNNYLEQISLKSGATVCISMLDRSEVILLDHRVANSAYRVVSDNGSRSPLHCTAQGKAILAWQSPSELRRIISEKGLVPYTPHTKVTVAAIEADLSKVREVGYAIEDGEYRIGLRSVAAPIRNYTGSVQYSIGVVGMFRRVQSEELQTARDLIVNAAQQISLAMGWQPEKQ